MHLVNVKVSEISVQVASISDRQKKTEKEFKNIQKSIDIGQNLTAFYFRTNSE